MTVDELGKQSRSSDVGIWIRVSTEDQARGESPEHHERRARAYAEAKGWKVREVYHLEAVSGKSVLGHPEVERMLIMGLLHSKDTSPGSCRVPSLDPSARIQLFVVIMDQRRDFVKIPRPYKQNPCNNTRSGYRTFNDYKS